MIRHSIEETSRFIVMYIKTFKEVVFKMCMHKRLMMVREHARETALINDVQDSYTVAIYGSDWIVSKRKRSGSSGAREE